MINSEYEIYHNSKNKNLFNLKIHISIVWGLCASVLRIWPLFKNLIVFMVKTLENCDLNRITRKIKIGKFIFHSIQPCVHLLLNWDDIWGGRGEWFCISLVGKSSRKIVFYAKLKRIVLTCYVFNHTAAIWNGCNYVYMIITFSGTYF